MVPGVREVTSRSDAAGGGEGAMQDEVKSVAELVVVICEDPENRKKRQKLVEALRERGLNESKLAAMYSGLAEKLSRNKEARRRWGGCGEVVV